MAAADQKATVEAIENVKPQDMKGADKLLVDAAGEVQHLPVPSSDPNDPLNFTMWEKMAIIISCCWFSIMSLSVVGGLGAVLNVFFEMYIPEGISATKVVWLATFPSPFVGVGNYLILPLGLIYGRRSATIASIIILLVATVGCAVSQTFGQHLGLRILQGLATGATESLLPLILSEVTFVHQRGMIFGVYWATQNVVTSCLNIASSYEVAALGWRWFYWVYVIAIGVGLLIVLFGCFETSYRRRAQILNGQVVVTDQFGVTHVLTGTPAQAYLQQIQDADDESTIRDEAQPKKSYLQMLRPYQKPGKQPVQTILMAWLHMFEAFSSPGILYSTLLSSVVLGSSIGMSLTYDTVLLNYGWSAKNVGLINLGGVFGGFGGMLYAGVFGDWFILRMAKRSNGVHTPEHRLILLIFPGILGVISLLLYGFTAEGSTWGGPYMGWALFQVTFVSVLVLSTSFAAEAWEQNPGPALVAVVGTKNIIGFGLSYGLVPMVAKYSYPTAMGVLAAVTGGVFLLGIPVYFFNPAWSRYMQRRELQKIDSPVA
ncbi:hypothetical protein N7474_005015 [Penicillium riverlandense]|uniref:uncharacterized protein n=1 Tax=Penicillium riverlandense TaxID=1903569 RepID=UPI00254836C7|nr:uncharacterized protein N7474_005015 [Penicillium riverlandense]KAJ5819424.1 hypothetical protein N7474_005015 [Penicillium riverlandense]